MIWNVRKQTTTNQNKKKNKIPKMSIALAGVAQWIEH